MYIAQVLQDPNSEEAGSGSGEDDGQGSSQDEEIINVQNGLNADFQSGEDSLIDNEVRHWSWWRLKKKGRKKKPNGPRVWLEECTDFM